MKELFREKDFTVIGYYQTILEGEGIPTLVKNKDLTGITEIAIPEFYPALCVVNDADYHRALQLLKDRTEKDERIRTSRSIVRSAPNQTRAILMSAGRVGTILEGKGTADP